MNLTRAQILKWIAELDGDHIMLEPVTFTRKNLLALCEMALRAEAAEAIVKELVRIEDLKDSFDGYPPSQWTPAQWRAHDEYTSTQAPAWASARDT